MALIRIWGYATGDASEFDGTFVKFYDPFWGTQGRLITTPDPAQAKVYPDGKAAFEEWRRSRGVRPDGKPDRPLTAFNVEIIG